MTSPTMRRVRGARSTLERVATQRDRFVTAYGRASSPQERFGTVSDALRSAAAVGRHQPRPEEVGERLDRLTEDMARLVDELHATQERTARRMLRADEKRRCGDDRGNRDAAAAAA